MFLYFKPELKHDNFFINLLEDSKRIYYSICMTLLSEKEMIEAFTKASFGTELRKRFYFISCRCAQRPGHRQGCKQGNRPAF